MVHFGPLISKKQKGVQQICWNTSYRNVTKEFREKNLIQIRLKMNHKMNIPIKLGFDWSTGFGEEY